MGIFNNFFGNTDDSNASESSKLQWKPLTTVSQLDEIVASSKTTPAAIFKHSTRCGISRMVIKRFENNYALEADQMDIYYLDLLQYRSISDEIAARFQVWHESPQLIVIKNGETVAHASHSEINSVPLTEFI